MKAHHGIRRRLAQLSPFAVICSLVAVMYIGYRAYSIGGPNGIGALLHRQQPATVDIGCAEDYVDIEPTLFDDSLPMISNHYQQYLQRQPAKGDNLIDNPTLERIDPNTGLPSGYYWTSEASYLKYSHDRDPSSRTRYLRVETTRKLTKNEQLGGWITAAIPTQPDATYAYSFSYRANVPVTISLEQIMANGEHVYTAITKIDGIDEWQNFTHYLNNYLGATSFRFIITSREAGRVDTRDYNVHRIADAKLPEGLVSIAFDDGWQSVWKWGMPLLKKYDMRSTQFIISEAADKKVPEYMNMDTLRKIRRAGHEIGSHTLTHCNQTKLTNTDILENARGSKATLLDNNLGPIDSFAYPYGKYDDNVQPLVAREYSYMRSSDDGYNDRYFDNRNIRSMMVLGSTSDQTFKSWLDFAKKYHMWVVISYHRINEQGPYSVTKEQLEQQLQMIKDSKLKVVPLTEAARSIRR